MENFILYSVVGVFVSVLVVLAVKERAERQRHGKIVAEYRKIRDDQAILGCVPDLATRETVIGRILDSLWTIRGIDPKAPGVARAVQEAEAQRKAVQAEIVIARAQACLAAGSTSDDLAVRREHIDKAQRVYAQAELDGLGGNGVFDQRLSDLEARALELEVDALLAEGRRAEAEEVRTRISCQKSTTAAR